jgi:serpin B
MATSRQKGRASACQVGQTAFAARLLERISAASLASGENLVFSPLSIHVALALMSTAAAGDTLDEILQVAGAPSRAELAVFVRDAVADRVLADRSGVGGPSLAFACGAWTDLRWPLRPAYVDAVKGTFKGNTWAVDFCNKVRTYTTYIRAF